MPGKDSNIRKDLAKRTYWRKRRIKRTANSVLGKHCKVTKVISFVGGEEREKIAMAGRTNLDVIPYYMADYLESLGREPFTDRWGMYSSGHQFNWGKPGKMGVRESWLMRYPRKYSRKSSEQWQTHAKAKGVNIPHIARRVINATRYFKVGDTRWDAERKRAHIRAKVRARLSLPVRVALRDFDRALKEMEDIAKEGGYY